MKTSMNTEQEMIRKVKNTHIYLHDRGLHMLNKDFENIEQYLNDATLLTENNLVVMKKKLVELNNFRRVFVKKATIPDKTERWVYFEKYEFINDYGMKVKRIKTFFPFFSRHFYCPAELGNYLRNASEKFSWLEKWFKDIKKQGLTYKRKVTYPDGVLPFVYSLK